MKKAITVLAFALILSPNLAFAATPNEQYISFLRQELAQLEAELVALESTSTLTTTPAVASTTGAVAVPVVPTPSPWVAPSECAGGNHAKLDLEGIDCAPPEFSE